MTRLRARCAKIDNLGFNLQLIARFHRVRPTKLIDAKTDRTFGKIERLHEQSHRDRRCVPTTGNQLAKYRRISYLAIEMKRLRIKLSREGNDLVLADRVRFRLESIGDLQVLEVTLFHQEFVRKWAVRVSNPRPPRCKRDALPLS